MKIGVVSDFHSNIVALKVCMEYLEKERCDEYFFLGDYISDAPYTREILDYIYEFIESHKCHLLRGNREDYVLAQYEARKQNDISKYWLYNSASGNLLYTYEQLKEKDFEFLNKLPISFKFEKEGYPSITCCHGSPANSREFLYKGSDQLDYWLSNIDTDYLIGAHTHTPGEIKYKDKYYFNSGSVGIALNDPGIAQCLIIQDEIVNDKLIWKPKFLRLPYDNKKVVRDIIECGLLDKAPWFINCCIKILLTGIDDTCEICDLAVKLSSEHNEKAK